MGDRLVKLKALELRLLEFMDNADNRTLAALARQYRETIREIEEIEGASKQDDEISEILSDREAAGESRSVR